MIFPGSILEKLGEYTAARNDPTILAKSLADEILFIPVTSNYNVSKQM
jgi:hypothetical protein